MATERTRSALPRFVSLKINFIKSSIIILKDPKIDSIFEQKDTQSSTVNDDFATRSINVTKFELNTIEIPNDATLMMLEGNKTGTSKLFTINNDKKREHGIDIQNNENNLSPISKRKRCDNEICYLYIHFLTRTIQKRKYQITLISYMVKNVLCRMIISY